VKIRGIGRLRRVVRGVRNLFVPRAIILLYHRVTEVASDPQLLCVSPAHFAQHLAIVRKYGNPTRLSLLDEALRRGHDGRSAIVVTFDDGYADNLCNAKPLLRRHEMPATVFMTTDILGSPKEFWHDDLERLCLHPGVLPETLRLTVNGKTFDYELGEASHYSEHAYRSNRTWNVSQKSTPTLRHQLYRSLVEMLQPLPTGERRTVVDDLLKWAGIGTTGRSTHRGLSPEELVQLEDGGIIDVGSHTVSHPTLSALPVTAQVDEISRSKAHLERILGHPITAFAYPYGKRSDYTEATVAAVRAAGFQFACSNFAGIVHSNTERWQLPRFIVRDWDGEEFAARLSSWLGDS
jgi:peptidoglycan/xylan/chitin deacetylase (PgdA/CDA1 family)